MPISDDHPMWSDPEFKRIRWNAWGSVWSKVIFVAVVGLGLLWWWD